MAYFRCLSGGGGGGTPPTTGSFQGSASLVKTISVDKKPSAVFFKNTTNTHKCSAEYFVGTSNNKQHYSYDDTDGTDQLGKTGTYAPMIQTVTSSSVSIRLPGTSGYASGTWEYKFYYDD